MDDKAVYTCHIMVVALSDMLAQLKGVMPGMKPPCVQEATLAQRHLEDALSRFEAAVLYAEGKDPYHVDLEDLGLIKKGDEDERKRDSGDTRT